MTNTILDRFDELVVENEKLKIELQEAKDYIDKLIDLVNLHEANAQFAIENQKLRDKIIQLQKEF